MSYWKDHGTKIIGSATALLGAVTTVNPDFLSGIFGPKAPAIATAVAGILTIIRGFTNSAQSTTEK